jgi:hypothetical protein
MNDFIPGEEESVAFQLFNSLWSVKISAIHLYSTEYIKHIGLPSTRDKTRDAWVHNEVRECLHSAVRLAELHDEGANIGFNNIDDVTKIYNLIQEHLGTWLDIFQKRFVINHPPLEDFEVLDSFAAAIYPITLYKGKPLTTMESLVLYLQGANSAIYNNVKAKEKDENGNDLDITVSGHRSYIQQIAMRIGHRVHRES